MDTTVQSHNPALRIESHHFFTAGKKRNALLLTGFFFFLNCGGLLAMLSQIDQPTTTPFTLGVMGVSLALNVAAFFMLRKDVTFPPYLILVAIHFIQGAVVQNLQQSGIGYIISTQILMFIAVSSVLLLPPNRMRWGILTGNLLGALAILVDFFGPASRPMLNEQSRLTLWGFILVITLFTVFIFVREWKSLTLDTKFLVTMLAGGEIIVLIVQVFVVGTSEAFFQTLNAVSADTATIKEAILRNNQGVFMVSGIGIVISGLFSFVISSSITRQLRAIVATLQDVIRTGDIHREITYRSGDEIGQMAEAIRNFMAYLQEMSLATTQLAEGRLNFSIQLVSEKDAFRASFNRMIRSLRETISSVARDAAALRLASEHLTMAVQETGLASGLISTNAQVITQQNARQVQEITQTRAAVEQMNHTIAGTVQGAQEQAQAVMASAALNTDIGKAIQALSSNVQAVAEKSAQAGQSAGAGVRSVEDTLQGMQIIREKVRDTSHKINEMGQRSEQISAIVETIEEIATQTNLLALNAAIEAARAGEQGKGFAVVAEEVRKLAERSTTSTREITALVQGIQASTREAVSSMKDGEAEVERGVFQANQAGKTLAEILAAVEDVQQQVVQILHAAQDMNVTSAEMLRASASVSAVVESNTTAMSAMAAGATQVTGAMQSIAGISQENQASIEQVAGSSVEIKAQI
ncbi:MAG: methyl-accepting chemotaxis protein, partial [Chloroflexi bacterium]|nr:methyl-accepting chemotaxis protein [Chloroflexota bacterium]